MAIRHAIMVNFILLYFELSAFKSIKKVKGVGPMTEDALLHYVFNCFVLVHG